MIVPLPRIPFSNEKAVQELQQYISKMVQDIISDGILNGRDVDLIFSAAGTQTITHSLGRPIKGAIVLSNSSGTNVATDAALGSNSVLNVTTSAATNLRIRVF